MIHLSLRTEYSFRQAFGRIDSVLDAAGGDAAAITDAGTWGHVAWDKACSARDIKPIFGANVLVITDATARERQSGSQMTLLARNGDGLKELYKLMSWASNEGFYYVPRLDYKKLKKISNNVIILTGGAPTVSKLNKKHKQTYHQMTPNSPGWNRLLARGKGGDYPIIITGDNLYPTPDDKDAYEVMMSQARGAGLDNRSSTSFIPSEGQLRIEIPEATDEMFGLTHLLSDSCNVELAVASMLRFDSQGKTLRDWCLMSERASLLADPVYQKRMDYELGLIDDKGFADYFFVIADMIRNAKEAMMVGPARGSSAGSLVCFLLEITDVDPILHGLMFERFIDANREDIPDIDIDFPSETRDDVIDYLRDLYGTEHVGRIGTVNRYKPKSVLTDVGKALGIPAYELKDLKGAIIERSSGDARAQFSIADTFTELDIGKATLMKYPELAISSQLEGHARYTGQHAAGVMVCNELVTDYATVDRFGTCLIDKGDAERLGLLKIDCLGLRTLDVIQDCLEQIGKDRMWLVDYPLDDGKAFNVLNEERYAGIFQFEGYALQALCRQMGVHKFDDIVAITALARPGPLHCGAATDFVANRTGSKETKSIHPVVAPLVSDTLGIVVYQEQVMEIARKVGDLSWGDVNLIRRAMSKSLGDEFFGQYWEKFRDGSKRLHDLDESSARRIWDNICTFGSWAFNKSHAVSYGLVSYWCAVLKARYPLEFAAATLRFSKDDEQGVKLLRELSKEGYKYTPVDPLNSGMSWTVHEGKLLGGLVNVKGIGLKMAADIIARRRRGDALQPGQQKKLDSAITPFDDIFEGQRRWGDIYKNPTEHNILSQGLTMITDIQDPDDYVFLAKIRDRNPRDLNEHHSLSKRDGRRIDKNNLFLNLTLEDDTGMIICTISRFKYARWGKELVENSRLGEWFVWRGKVRDDGWRKVYIDKWRRLEDA